MDTALLWKLAWFVPVVLAFVIIFVLYNQKRISRKAFSLSYICICALMVIIDLLTKNWGMIFFWLILIVIRAKDLRDN
jgi:hypothetical protein